MSYIHLTLEERYVIYHLVLYGLSLREIGRRLNRHHMTISREVKTQNTSSPVSIVVYYLSSLNTPDNDMMQRPGCIQSGSSRHDSAL